VPPLAASAAEYATPTTPAGKDVVVMVGGACTVIVVLLVTALNVAVIVVIPALTPDASPAVLMVATAILEELQVT
jgi:hypothetical protein